MITPFQIATFFIYSVAIVLAIYFSTNIAEDGAGAFIKILGTMGSLAWILFGSRIWWVPLFLGIGFGGVFWVGFKVYPQEVALALALVTVAPAMILQRFWLRPRRKKLPSVFVILFGYLTVECLYSCLRSGGSMQGIGGIFRIYFLALWPFLFVTGFSFYSFSQHIRWGLYALQRGYLARISMELATFLMPGFLYLPGINFVLPGSTLGGFDDLRTAGLGLALVSLALLFSKRGIYLSRRTFFFPVIQVIRLLEAVAALLFGGGRFNLIACFLAIGFALIYARKWIVVSVLLVVVGGGMGWINMYPQIIEKLPDRVQRTASILILKENAVAMQERLQGSNLWHQRLREIGFQRWIENPVSFFFGTGVKAFDYTVGQGAGDELFDRSLENAANVGGYENGLFTVLSLTGLVGFALYATLFFQLIRRIWLLQAVADQDDFGRTLSFYALCQAALWIISCYFSGGWPSFELMILGVAVVYLQERADEQEISPSPQETIPFHELTKS